MFCKWCGGRLSASDTKCKQCGREVPAVSDCGGFYDIMQGETPVQQPVKAKTPAALIVVMTGGFAVLLALLLVMFLNQKMLTQELSDLRDDFEDLTAEMVQEEIEETENEITEDITVELPDDTEP